MRSVVIVDDHILLRSGLANLIDCFGNYKVIYQSNNGKELVEGFDKNDVPDIILLDINMPQMDGFETCVWLKSNYPDIKVLALSMYDNENSIIRMLKSGAKGYILKDCEPVELRNALESVSLKGYYYSELVTGKLINTINADSNSDENSKELPNLSEREITFLKYACTELTYKQIADEMFLSPRTIDGYRDALFEKLKIKTRVGLAMYAIKNGIVIL